MRALELPHPAEAHHFPLRMVDRPEPSPDSGEVAVRVEACGVCRTDLHVVEGDLVAPHYPIVPGHQAVGRVIALGEGVTNLSLGDRVGVAWVARFCGDCRYCRNGEENLCLHPVFTGFHRDGGFAETVTAPADFVHPLPAGLGDAVHVAPLLCAGIIGYRALKRSGLRPGRSVALYGFGAAAHVALQVARAWDCEVHVVTREPEAILRARRMGAAWAGTFGEAPPSLVEHAVTFAPVGSVIPPALEHLARGGTLSIAGIHLDEVPRLDYQKHLFQEKAIRSTTANTREDARELLEIAATGAIDTDVEEVPFAEANTALARLKEGTLHAQAAVLRIAP